MKRKRAILYLKLGLCDDYDQLVQRAESWAKRRRLIVTEIVAEASERQPRLLRLLSCLRSARGSPDYIISPSLYHFSYLPKLLHTLARLHESGIGIGFSEENILLPGAAATTRSLYRLGTSYVEAERFGRAQAIKQALRVRAIFGKRLGRERLPQAIRREAEHHLQGGLSLRATVKAMNGRISRSSVANLRRELKKRQD